jgi:pathogenesis-related protein 1
MGTKLFSAGLLVLLLCGSAGAQSWNPQDMVAAHNFYRAQVKVPALRWSSSLATRAQQWANTLIQRRTFAPRRDGVFGENLYEVVNGRATPVEVLKAWVSEKANYRYDSNSCSARCGHYTQVIWRDTREVGCGVARDSRREVWVCNYDPPGNVVGERPY